MTTFKRGQDPKDALNIGIKAQLIKYIKKEYPKLGVLDKDHVLRIVAGDGKLQFVQYLVEKEGADIHDNDEHALRWAAEAGHLDVVKYLIEHGADATVNNNIALRWAKDKGHKNVVDYLENHMKGIKESFYPRLYESFEFTRGLDPKAAMNVGIAPQIEEWLKNKNIKNYKILPGLAIDVFDEIRLNFTEISELPDFINFNIVDNDFTAYNSNFKSLKGFPKQINGNFDISNNKLKSLKGCPEIINGKFNCSFNRLKTLDGAPKKVMGDFVCEGNYEIFSEIEVKSWCNVKGTIQVDTNAAQRWREQREKRKTSVPVAQRTSHILGKTKHGRDTFQEYTKGYKGFKVYEFIRDNGPLTAEEIGRFAHDMTYGSTWEDKDGTRVPYNRSEVTGHGQGYLVKHNTDIPNDKVIRIKKGKFKYLDEYKISPIGEAYLKKNEPKFG